MSKLTAFAIVAALLFAAALAITGEAPKVDWCEAPSSMPIDRPECWR